MVRQLESGLSAHSARRYTRSQQGTTLEPQGTPSPAGVPTELATVGDLLEWVGQDTDRAQLVLEQENAKGSPRKTLIEPLANLILEA